MWKVAKGHQVTAGIDRLFDGHGQTMTARDVAELLGVTKQTVHNWLRDGIIPGYKVGSAWIIITSELKEAIRKGENTPRVPPKKKKDE